MTTREPIIDLEAMTPLILGGANPDEPELVTSLVRALKAAVRSARRELEALQFESAGRLLKEISPGRLDGYGQRLHFPRLVGRG
jgi:hypothetical protein